MKLDIKNANGNGVLEALLCTPLALMLLFVVTDGGLALVERAAITDALRAGAKSEAQLLSSADAMSFDGSLLLSEHTSEINALSQRVADDVSAKLSAIKDAALADSSAPYRVAVTPVVASIDSDSGALTTYRSMDTRYGGDTSFELSHAVPEYPVVAIDQFLAQRLGGAGGSPSQYAFALGVAYNAEDPHAASLRYLEQSLLLHIEVTTLTNGLNRQYVNSTLGRFYALQDQELFVVRTQLQ